MGVVKERKEMLKQSIVVKNASGLHLRPAGDLCKESLKYESKISIIFGNTVANAKSVLSVLGACIKKGDEIEIECKGKDEEEALKAIINLVENGFGETE
mgnify:FL=1